MESKDSYTLESSEDTLQLCLKESRFQALLQDTSNLLITLLEIDKKYEISTMHVLSIA